MRRNTLILAWLLILMIALVARTHSRLADVSADAPAGIDGDTPASATVMSTLRRACFDCHSDETRRPWYSALPVASWLIEHHVRQGRGQLNFSRWAEYNRFDRADLLDKACDLATKGDMPLWQYRLLHREARLGASDITALCAWTRREAARLVEERP